MTIGTVFYEKYLNLNNAQSHLNWLIEQSFEHLEFTVHEKLFDLKVLELLIKNAHSSGIVISYHSPDFIDFNQFSLFGLSQQKNEHNTLRYFSQLSENSNQDHSNFVIHGLSVNDYKHVKGYAPSAEQLKDFNFRSLDKLLNLIQKNKLPIRVCIENTAPQDGITYGQVPNELTLLHQAFNSSHFSFCIDLAHLWRSSRKNNFDPEQFIETALQLNLGISQFHLHGFSTNLEVSHCSLTNTNEAFLSFVKAIHSKKLKKTFVLECFFSDEVPDLSTYENKLLQEIALF